MRTHRLDGYLPIEDYGAIGNLRTVALVGIDGSIDWCCLPELDRASVFGAILDHRRGGRFQIRPRGHWQSSQQYIEATNVLETRFEQGSGRLRLTDFMPLRGSILGAGAPPTAPEIHRVLHCEQGEVLVEVEWSPRFDYGRARMSMRSEGKCVVASAGSDQIVLGGLPEGSSEIGSDDDAPVLRARFRLMAGQRHVLVTRWAADHVHVDLEATRRTLHQTVSSWREWAEECERKGGCGFEGRWKRQLGRAGLALKLLTHPDTGAIAAAATTSLPEEIGGVRNWDYRFSWIRDSAFAAQALAGLGHRADALDFLEWAERVTEAPGEKGWGVQIMYGLHGESDLAERVLDHLEGYRGSRPVRIGNAAADQHQLDIYGELVNAVYEFVRLGGRFERPMREFVARIADQAAKRWREEDHGIWEVRGGPRHFVYSKLMTWVALDRALRLAKRHPLPGNHDHWIHERDAIRAAILSEGFDEQIGSFVQSFGSTDLDAANLLIPILEFLPFDDPRVQGTIDSTLSRLTKDGFVYRYLADDGIAGGEGAFIFSTFWLVDALVLSGRRDEARDIFNGMAERANHVGLYAEEIDPATGAFLGNFPQAFSHIGFINSALLLARDEGQRPSAPAPMGSREHRAEGGHEPGAAV